MKQLSESQVKISSHKIMLRMGLIRQSCAGVYHLLPLGLRALEKLIALIDKHMRSIGAVKMAMPMILPSSLLKRSGRWSDIGQELFRLNDRHGTEYCLGPTHEEVVTNLVKEELVSRKQLPLKLYQLDRKFRDEKRPKHGLLRAREFWMKDLYSFDESEEDASRTYELVCNCYERILEQLNLPILKVKADPGNIGGSLSHEYHIPCDVGEDTIRYCEKCNFHSNEDGIPSCPHVSSHSCQFCEIKGIEVAHAFFLGTKYTDMFDVSYVDHDGSKSVVQMGCYGIGVSRVLAAAVEYGCKHQSEKLVWPRAIAPYPICIAPMSQSPCDSLLERAMELYDIVSHSFPGEVVLEDRLHLTLGARLRSVESQGYLVGIIVGDKVPEEKTELHIMKNTECEKHVIQTSELVDTLHSILNKK